MFLSGESLKKYEAKITTNVEQMLFASYAWISEVKSATKFCCQDEWLDGF